MTRPPRKLTWLHLTGAAMLITGIGMVGSFIYDNTWANLAVEAQQEQDANAMTFPSPTASNTTSVPVLAAYPEKYEVFARLRIPAFGSRWARKIAETTSVPKVLDSIGVGHYPGTALPGGIGNFSVAGHRTTHGAAFMNLDKLRKGDAIFVETADGTYEYRVVSHAVVSPSHTEVIAPVPGDWKAEPSERWMTLTTCTPKYTAISRLVVHAKFVQFVPVVAR